MTLYPKMADPGLREELRDWMDKLETSRNSLGMVTSVDPFEKKALDYALGELTGLIESVKDHLDKGDSEWATAHAAAVYLGLAYRKLADSINVSYSHYAGQLDTAADARASYMIGFGLHNLASNGWLSDDAIRPGTRP